MSYQDDPELEARLRRVAADPQPDAPASLFRALDKVARGEGTRGADGLELARARPVGGGPSVRRGPSGLRQIGALTALAAALAIAISAAGLLVATRGPATTASWTLLPDAGQGQWTGLEWHDITSTAGGLARSQSFTTATAGSGVVQWRGGYATMGGDFKLWLSTDGITWRSSSGGPTFPAAVAIGDDLLVAGMASDGSQTGLWLTRDGVAWAPVSAPFDVSTVSGLVSGEPGVVAVTTNQTVDPPGPSKIYLTTDARTWTPASLPADLASAYQVTVSRFIDGFIAVGLVSDPNGAEGYSSGTGAERHYSYRSWRSRDGLTWTAYDPALPAAAVSSNVPPWALMQLGKVGAGNGLIHSTDGGATWLLDDDSFPGSLSGDQTASDGSRIIMAAESGAVFYLSEGDGHWTQLQQGGDVGSLPADGQLLLLPNGVLWIAADRVYFGQGLAGVAPEGSLGPPTTPSPGPTLAYPTSTPALEATATASPGPTMTATGFTTPGLSTGWTGFSWSQLAAGNPMAQDSGQLDGSGVSQVLRWRGGYVATGSVSLFGQTSPSLGLWASPDGQTWTAVSSIDAAAVVVSAAPVGLVAIGVDPEGSMVPRSVWTSSDGASWHDAGTPNLAGSLVSMAGTDTGILATVDIPGSGARGSYDSYLIEYSTDGVTWTPENVGDLSSSQGGYGLPPHVQSNDGHFYLMGSAGPLTSSSDVRLVSSEVRDEMWLSDDGKTWTRSGGGYSMLADVIDFGRDGMLLHTNAAAVPGGNGLAYSTDGGATWHDETNYGPLGKEQCQGECGTGPNGVIGSNGTVFVAVETGGKKAWLSFDGHTWSTVEWAGGDPSDAGYGGYGGFLVMPRGVILAGAYGAAR